MSASYQLWLKYYLMREMASDLHHIDPKQRDPNDNHSSQGSYHAIVNILYIEMWDCAEDRFCHRGRCGAINFYETTNLAS